MSTPTRYHPFLVCLHWLLALVLIADLAFGALVLRSTPNTSAEKPGMLGGHMLIGAIILLLMLARLCTRLLSSRPAAAEAGNAILNQLARVTHWALYALVFLTLGSGIAISVESGLPNVVFRHVGMLPVNFDSFGARAAHGMLATVLTCTIGLHFAAAAYHQFVRRDRLLQRMSWAQPKASRLLTATARDEA